MRTSIAAAAALLLVACGGRDDADNAQADGDEAVTVEAAGEGSDVTLEPGEWETTVQVASMNMPNMPAGMSAPTPPATTIRTCLTPDQVRQPNADFLTGTRNDGCTYENMSMRGGRLQGAVQCNTEGGAMRSTFDGRFTPTSYEMNQRMQMSGGGPAGGMEVESRITGRRIGDCPAG